MLRMITGEKGNVLWLGEGGELFENEERVYWVRPEIILVANRGDVLEFLKIRLLLKFLDGP